VRVFLLRPEGSFCPLRPVDLGTAILWPGTWCGASGSAVSVG